MSERISRKHRLGIGNSVQRVKEKVFGQRPTEIVDLPSTEEQINAGNVAFYLKLVDLIKMGGNSYAAWRETKGENSSNEVQSNKERARIALEDLYYSQKDPVSFQRFVDNWGEQTHVFEGILKGLGPRITELHEKYQVNAYTLTPNHRRKVAMEAAIKLPKLLPHQKSRLLDAAGYSQEDREKTWATIAKSFGYSGILEPSKEVISIAGGLLLQGMISERFGDISLAEAIILGNIIYYSSLITVAEQNLRLLRDTGNSPNGIATATYYITKNMLPKNPRLRELATRLASFGFEPIKEGVWNVVPFFPDKGSDVFLGACVTVALTNAIQTGISELTLRRSKNNSQE